MTNIKQLYTINTIIMNIINLRAFYGFTRLFTATASNSTTLQNATCAKLCSVIPVTNKVPSIIPSARKENVTAILPKSLRFINGKVGNNLEKGFKKYLDVGKKLRIARSYSNKHF